MQQNSTNTATNFQVAIVYAVSVRQNWAFPGLSLNFRIFNAFTNRSATTTVPVSLGVLPIGILIKATATDRKPSPRHFRSDVNP